MIKILHNKNNGGFTLIELLVVISIISILSTVILAGVKEIRNKAEIRAFEKELLDIRTAVYLYREKTGNWPNSFYSYDGLSFPKLVEELYVGGVYSSKTIKMPKDVAADAMTAFKADPRPGYSASKYGCGSSNYSDIAYIIFFYSDYVDGYYQSITGNRPIKTSFPYLYETYLDDSGGYRYDGTDPNTDYGYGNTYGYCIAIK